MRFATPKPDVRVGRSLSVRSRVLRRPAGPQDPSSSTRNLLAVAALVLAFPVGASPLFDDDAILSVSLTGPFSTLIDEKKDRAEMPFVLRANGVEHHIEVRVRGKSRLRVCDFPPLRLNFPATNSEETVFADQDKLKLVTHCRKGDLAQADMLEEYAAYKILNLISDVSYKVRLVEIAYHDTDERMKEPRFVRRGFLIESAGELADRVGGKPAHVGGASLKSLDQEQAALVFVFQYLIGNTDWSLVTADADDTCCHNIDLFDIGSLRFPVPYDFDLSGLENTPYAKPDPSIGTRNVTQRRYRGYCLPSGAPIDAVKTIAGRESDILGVLSQVPGLPAKKIETGNKYLADFFKRAKDADKLARSFERRCL